MVQIVCTLLLFIVIIFPIGNYVYHISSGERTFADPVFDKMDNCMFKVLKIRYVNNDLEKICCVIIDS